MVRVGVMMNGGREIRLQDFVNRVKMGRRKVYMVDGAWSPQLEEGLVRRETRGRLRLVPNSARFLNSRLN